MAAANPRKAAVARAAMAAFEPLASLFVELGISIPEAESLLRSVFVHAVVRRERGIEGKPVSLSRVALLTGVHRNEVKRILTSPPRIDPEREIRRHRANRILSAWYADPDYTTADGQPRELEVKSDVRRAHTFWTLVERYSPGVWPRLILEELVRVGAVEELGDDRLRVRMQSYGVDGSPIEAIAEVGQRAHDLLHTLVHNVQQPDDPRLCETVLTVDMDPKWLPVLRNTWQRRARVFLAGINEDISSQKATRAEGAGPSVRVGLTVFYFEGAAMEEAKSGRRKAKVPRAKRVS